MDPKSPTEGPPCSAGLVHRSLWWQRWHRVTDGMVLTWWAWWSGWQTTKCSPYDSSEQKGQTAAGAWGLSSLLWANRRPSVHTLTWVAETLPTPGGSAHHGLLCKEADSGEKKNKAPQVCWRPSRTSSRTMPPTVRWLRPPTTDCAG